MFSTVLIPTDLSAASERLVECADSLVPLGMKSIVLLHALGLRHLDSMAPALAEDVRPRVEKLSALLRRTGLPVEVVVAPGVAHKEISRVAREHRASLVLLGSQGASLASELRIGSVTLETLHHSEVPVLVARVTCRSSGEAMIECRLPTSRILHPTDFSTSAERAFAYVRALVDGGMKTISLLHVQDRRQPQGHSSEQLAAFDQNDAGRLRALARELENAGAAVSTEIASGSPIQEILRRIAAAPESLVVMGTQGRGFIPELFLGSVSHAVARQAVAPVLLVPSRPSASA